MNGRDTVLLPIGGRQNVIRGTGTLPDATDPIQPPALAGVTLNTGTYDFAIPVDGAGAVDVVLRVSAATGTGLNSTATIQALLNDQLTPKGTTTAAAAAFVVGTQQVLSLTALRGERVVRLRIVVPAASSVTFDQAEYSAK